jgi:DNA-binding transcriptional LysR family regulator
LDFEYLKTFLTVAKYGGISQAANELYLTQTTVTNRLKELQKELGIVLFDRNGRSMQLTTDGQAYLAYAERSLALLDEAHNRLMLHSSEYKGEITLASTSNICTYLLPDWLAKFRKRFPDLRLKISTGHSRPIMDQVLKGNIDIGLVRGPIDHNGLHVFPLVRARVVPVVSIDHPWFGKKTVTVQSFYGQKVIAYNRNSSVWAKLENWFGNHGIVLNIQVDLDHVESSKLMVQNGQGIAFLPIYTISEELQQGKLCTFEMDPPLLLFSNTDIIYNRKNPLPMHTLELARFLSKINKSEG